MKLDPETLQQLVDRTLDHYHTRAEAFWEGTRHHDVEQNIETLLRHIQAAPPFTILDFGCGPGRDLSAFVQRGHRAVGLEGAPALAAMARAHSACEVWQQDFLRLDLPEACFDGVFANAALFTAAPLFLYDPAVVVYHFENVTTDGTPSLNYRYLTVKNGLAFKRKWRHRFAKENGPEDASMKRSAAWPRRSARGYGDNRDGRTPNS